MSVNITHIHHSKTGRSTSILTDQWTRLQRELVRTGWKSTGSGIGASNPETPDAATLTGQPRVAPKPPPVRTKPVLLHVAPHLDHPSGIYTHIAKTLPALKENYDVHILRTSKNIPEFDCEEHVADKPAVVENFLEQLKPDLIYHHHPTADFGRYTKCPVVWHLHADQPLHYPPPRWCEPAAVIANSPVEKTDSAWRGVDVHYLKQATDENLFTELLSVGVVGRLDDDKFPGDFAKKLRAWRMFDWIALTFVGSASGTGAERRLRDIFKDCDNVTFRGAVAYEKLPFEYAKFDVVIIPSTGDSANQVVGEALACGCRVIVSDLPGIRYTYGEREGLYYTKKEDDILDCMGGLIVRAAQGQSVTIRSGSTAYNAALTEILDKAVDANRPKPVKPSITVITPVYNTKPEWLREAAESVKNQTVKPTEHIIIDDGSTDPDTIAELSRLEESCRVIRLPRNLGGGPARNAALKAATTDWIAILDSDDVAEPRWIEAAYTNHLTHPDADIIGTAVTLMDGRTLAPLPEMVTFDSMKKKQWIACHPGMIYRRKKALAAGGYGTTRTGHDMSLWRRMLARGSIIRNFPEALVKYREHGGQLTWRSDRAENIEAVMNAPTHRRKRLLVGSYFQPDPNSAGGGPNIYIDEVKHLEARDDYEIKWVYSNAGEMSEGNVVSDEGLELRREWKSERVVLGDKANMARVLKSFKPDAVFPLGWHYALDLLAGMKEAGYHAPMYTRVEHVNFLSGEISIDNAQNELTKVQHEWQISVKDKELIAYRNSDALLCVSEDDAECLREHLPGNAVYFVPPAVPVEKRQYNPESKSKDVVFLGGTWHRGNIDALIYFMRDVWPKVKEQCPDSKVRICGVCDGVGLGQWQAAKKIVDQYEDDIIILGYLEDLGDVFEDIACSVVPVITGGGVKIKFQTSLSYRCPAITTPWVDAEYRLGSEYAPLIGYDDDDYAAKIVNTIKSHDHRRELLVLVDQFNEAWSRTARNKALDEAIPPPVPRILAAANCLTMPIADRSTQLFQARSDTLARLLRGEENTADYGELVPYFRPGMVTPLPRKLDANWDIFLWSNMVDETTWAIDFHGWPFGPNHAYDDALLKSRAGEFWNKYSKLPKPTLEEREANYRAIDDLLTSANPRVRKIILLYETSRFWDVKPDAAESYERSAAHMAETLQPLGWEVYAVPKGHPRANDEHWAHYDMEWTREWLAGIIGGDHAVQ